MHTTWLGQIIMKPLIYFAKVQEDNIIMIYYTP
jgi:hypothetical protein